MTDVAKRVIGYLVLGAIALAVVLFALGKLSAIFGNDASITAASVSALDKHPQLKRFRDSLHTIELAGRKTSDRLAGVAGNLRKQLDSIMADTLDTTTPVDWHRIATKWVVVADSLTGAWSACRQSLTTCEQRADSAEAEADTLRKRLAKQVKVESHPCGLFLGLGGSAGKGAGVGFSAGIGCNVLKFPWP